MQWIGVLVLSVFLTGILAANKPCNPTCGAGFRCEYETCISETWPVMDAMYVGRVIVENELEPNFDLVNLGTYDNIKRGGPDDRWLHLHRDSTDALTSTLTIQWIQCSGSSLWNSGNGDSGILSNFQIQYVIGESQVPVSGWLNYPFAGSIDVNQANFDTDFPEDGIFHIGFNMQGTGTLTDFKPEAAYVHIRRSGFPVSNRTPVGIHEPDESGNPYGCSPFSPNIIYIDIDSRDHKGYPANPSVEPFTDFKTSRDAHELYIEQLGPSTKLFQPLQMWWADPAADNLPFVRGMPPKFDEAHNWHWSYSELNAQWEPETLRIRSRHERFPVKDGPRGVGWMSAYVSGQVDSQGRFIFTETSGRVGYLYPNGDIYTIAGHVTDPNEDPIWLKKTTDVVRQNQVLRGNWLSGVRSGEEGGFRLPLDASPDPNNEDIIYVAAYEDNCIWRIEIRDLACGDVDVSVFAGSVDHEAGDADGVGNDARFDGPVSLIFDPTADCIYVSDQRRSRIRKITRDGTVTTIYGSASVAGNGKIEYPWGPPSLTSDMEVFRWWDQEFNAVENGAAAMDFTPSPPVVEGTNPDVFLPHTIRVDSKGNIILLSLGWGVIREINPTTHAAVIRARVHAKTAKYSRGWAWMDVDRWGNSGGLDSIYWCKFVGEVYGSQHGTSATGDPGCAYPNGIGQWKEPACGDEATCNTQCNNELHRCPEGCAVNMFSEIYGWAPGENDDEKSYLTFTQDWGGFFGRAQEINPPHYPWLVAVDPRGSVIFGGAGVQGLIRMRKTRNDDPIPEDTSVGHDYYYNYWNGRRIYEAGTPKGEYGQGPLEASVGPFNLFNWDGHNLLGIGDSWGIAAMSDAEVLDYFQVSDLIRADNDATAKVLWYLRNAQGTTSTAQPNIVDTAQNPGVCGSDGDGDGDNDGDDGDNDGDETTTDTDETTDNGDNGSAFGLRPSLIF